MPERAATDEGNKSWTTIKTSYGDAGDHTDDTHMVAADAQRATQRLVDAEVTCEDISTMSGVFCLADRIDIIRPVEETGREAQVDKRTGHLVDVLLSRAV